MAPSDFNREHMQAVNRIFQRFSLEDQRSYWQRTTQRYHKAASQVNLIVAIFAFLTGFSAALAGLLVSAYLVPGSFANGGACAELDDSRGLIRSLQSLGVITAEDDISALQSLSVTREGATAQTQIDSERVNEALDALANIDPAQCESVQGVVNILMILAVVTPAIGGAFTTLASLYQWDRTVNIYEGALENLEVADSQSPLDDMDDLTYKAALRAYVENTLRVMAEETAQWGQAVRTPPQLEAFIEEERQKAARAMRRTGRSPLTTSSGEGDESPPRPDPNAVP